MGVSRHCKLAPPPFPLKYKTFAPTFTSLPPNLLIRFLTVKNIFFFCRNQNAFFSTFESIKKKKLLKDFRANS